MTRSLFFAFFVRLTIAMAFVLAIRSWIVPHGLVLASLLVLGWASLSAYLLARSVRSSILPLQTAAATLAKGSAEDHSTGTLAANLSERILQGGYSDFDSLARALSRTSREVQRALNETSESRHELEAMIDSLQDAVVALDPAGRIQWSNERMQRLLPAWSGGSAAGRGTVRVGHALVQTIRDPDVLECVRTAIEQRTFCQRRSTLLVPGRIFEINSSPMPSGGAVALIHDVTRVEQVERTQREFVANVSHELRTPLTSISGYVETLLDHETSLSPQARSFLTTILKNATRMNRLTEDLLTMARVESAEQELHPTPLAADLLVRDAVQSMSGLIHDTDAILEIADLPLSPVLVDPDAAVQVLSNLIENAIKYGKDRSSGIARVVLSAQQVAEPVPAVEFSVRDFGPGIASEHLPRLFERFYRVDKARSLESGGTGLGLAIARHIVEAQGGTIRAESNLNAGSDFRFTLPLSPPEPATPKEEPGSTFD